MAYNYTKLQVEALKQDGLTITDKRGLPFGSHEERWLEHENALLIRQYADCLNEAEGMSAEDRRVAMREFKIKFGIWN